MHVCTEVSALCSFYIVCMGVAEGSTNSAGVGTNSGWMRWKYSPVRTGSFLKWLTLGRPCCCCDGVEGAFMVSVFHDDSRFALPLGTIGPASVFM